MKKLNMTVGHFQPMTIGHNNMIEEGDAPCINTQAIGHTELEDKENYHLMKLDTVKKYAKYII